MRTMGLDPQALIIRVLKEAHLEEPLRRFFLSDRPGVIYGGGYVVKRLLACCHVFHKKIVCLLVLPDEGCTAVMRHGYVPCHEARALPEQFEAREHDLLFGLHESRHAELESSLVEDGIEFATVCAPSSWENSLEALEAAKSRLFALYEEYEKNAARTSAAAQAVHVSSARKKLIIHAGMPKTGTTALQKFLFINRDRLKQLGFYYKTPLRDEEKHKEMLAATKIFTLKTCVAQIMTIFFPQNILYSRISMISKYLPPISKLNLSSTYGNRLASRNPTCCILCAPIR